METVLSYLITLAPLIINAACIIIKKGNIVSLIATLCGAVPALLLLMINSGYGIGFGNPWIGVDWGITVLYLLYISVLLVTHAFVPSSGTIKKVSVVVIVLICLCTLFVLGSQIINTLEHR